MSRGPDHSLRARSNLAAQRAVEFVLTLTGLVVLAVPLLAIALVVKLNSAGPVLFRQRRVGLHGKPFTMYKFRTMHTGAGDAELRDLIVRELRGEDTATEGSCKLDAGTQVTRVGGVLRSTSLDELPQLFNVIGGSMRLVGPRPCLEWEAKLFPPQFAERFSVPPGITGLWQVSGRSTMGTLDMLQLDIEYVRSRGFWTDLGILVRTVPTLIRRDGAR